MPDPERAGPTDEGAFGYAGIGRMVASLLRRRVAARALLSVAQRSEGSSSSRERG